MGTGGVSNSLGLWRDVPYLHLVHREDVLVKSCLQLGLLAWGHHGKQTSILAQHCCNIYCATGWRAECLHAETECGTVLLPLERQFGASMIWQNR